MAQVCALVCITVFQRHSRGRWFVSGKEEVATGKKGKKAQ
jgi:hypothetical protein